MIRKILGCAALWAVLAAFASTLIWIALTTTFLPLAMGDAFDEIRAFWFPRAVVAAYFGGGIAVLALLFYVPVFAVWLAVVQRDPRLELTNRRLAVASLGLALPVIVAIVTSFVIGANSWRSLREAGVVVPWALAATWGGILIPRVLVPSLAKGGAAAA